ncbi:MAG: indole-3-glycerol phosphate synthase TrpC [Actinobacteria bacterium]|nr:MAG: indole-3-glycerol phosphate synthase TrpC [Actinomycetota bacterium]
MSILSDIVEKKRKCVELSKEKSPLNSLKNQATLMPLTRDFKQSLISSDIAVIAEIKKASPSAGVIRDDFNPVDIAKQYQKAGAVAISVITEEDFFLGNPNYLKQVKETVELPVLRKDFIIEPYQIYESRVLGADAVLLIASILDSYQLSELIELAKSMGMAALVEVHTKEELEVTLLCRADIIGINNRNLDTFEVNLAISEELKPYITSDKVSVSESGIYSSADVLRLREAGFNAILVGESLLKSENIEGKLKELKVKGG